MLLAIAALTSCDEQPSPNGSTPIAVDDSAAAYAALSVTLAHCDDANETCLEAAGESGRARQRCASELETCRTQAKPAEEVAENTLERETHWCHKVCTDEDAGPGGADDADGGSGDLDDCIAGHAPKLPKCLKGLFKCLNKAGIFERDASRRELRSCVRETHGCIKDRLAELRDKHHGSHHGAGFGAPDAGPAGGSGGAATAGSGGESAGSGAAGTAGNGGAEAVAPSDDGRHGRKHKRHGQPFWKR
jgi:hypothetical protein